MKNYFFIMLIIFLILTSCRSEINKMISDVDQASDSINTIMIKARETAEKLDEFSEELYKNKDKYDLSIENMDTDKGGKYSLFNGKQYYKSVNDGGACFLVSMELKDYTESKQRIRLFENIEPLMNDMSSDFFGQQILCENYVGVLYPWYDAVSSLPPNIDYTKFFWYNLADPEHNPEKKSVWVRDVFAQLAYGGWVKDILVPIYDDKDIFRGVASCSVFLKTTSDSIQNNYKTPLLFITEKGKVINANKRALNILKIKVLNQYYYYEQLKENKFIEEEFNLTYKDYSEEIRNLGAKILTENNFYIQISGKKYFVYKNNIQEQNDLLVVGLIEN